MDKKLIVMTVDDEIRTVNLVKLVLESAGFDVLTATSGKECLEKIKSNKVDLVLLDVMMPDMSGWDVLEELRRTGKMSEIKVALLTVLKASTDRIAKLKEIGVADYITKPFSPESLVNRVKSILNMT